MNDSASPKPDYELAGASPRHQRPASRDFSNNHLLPIAVLVAAVCLFRWPLISGLYTVLDTGPDLAQMTIPDFEFRAHALRDGLIPLWSNYHHGGQAFLGELISGLFNPFSYLLLALPLKNGHIRPDAYMGYFVFLGCLAAISAYFLLRDLRCSRWAAVVAALFYAIGGPPGNSNWIEFVTEVIYTPLVLLFLFRSLRGQRPLANCAISGAIAGISWFSGTHHFPLITSIACVATLLAFSAGGYWKLGLARAAVFSVVLAFFAAPQVLPSIEFSKLSLRWVGLPDPVVGSKKVPYAAHIIEYLHPSHLLDIPFALSLSYWGAGMAFAGVVALSFLPFAVASLSGTRLLRLLAAFAVAGILLAMSPWNTLYGVVYLLLPAFDKLRECLTWIFLAHLALTCLFGIGLTVFLNGGEPAVRRRMKHILFVAGPVLLATGYTLAIFGRPEWRDPGDRLSMAGLALLLVAGVILLFERRRMRPAFCACFLGAILMIEHGNVSGQSSLRFLPRHAETAKRYSGPVLANDELAAYLKTRSDLVRIDVNPSDIPENFGEMHGIEELSGHGASLLTSVYELPFWGPKSRQMYGVNYFVAKVPADGSQQPLYTAASGISVFTNPGARRRVWSVHKVVPVSNWDEARRLLESSAFDLSDATFLERKVHQPALEDCPASADQVRLQERTLSYVKIQSNLRCRGIVILSDNFYPGWRASIDGHHVPILPAYMSVRGVVVNAGEHIIEMHYRPWSLYLGMILCVIGFAGTVLLCTRSEQPAENLLA